MKRIFFTLLLLAMVTLSACMQTSSTEFKSNHPAFTPAVLSSPPAVTTTSVLLSAPTPARNKASFAIGSTINQTHLISSDGENANPKAVEKNSN